MSAGVQGGIQHVDRSAVVHLVELPAIPRPQIRIGREVIDPSPAFQCPPHCSAIANVRETHFRCGWQMAYRRSRPFHHAHLLAGINQPFDEVAADEPRATGYNRQVVHE